MIRFQHLLLASILVAPACSAKKTGANGFTNAPVLEITATHAIEIEQSATDISFVPNNVAPWLGRIILNNDDNGLSTTDIEGRAANNISEKTYIDTIGLARENASGVFLAINDRLNAFVEADEQGNFAPLSYSGTILAPISFCETDAEQGNSARILTSNGEIATLSLTIAEGENAENAPIEQDLTESLPTPANASKCANSATLTFAYSNSGSKGQIHTHSDGNWKKTAVSSTVSSLVPVTLNGTVYLVLLDNEDVFLFNTSSQKVEYRLVVTSGLSIAGLEKTKFIGSTIHNFGGAAFSEGLVAFGQADEDRIVFVSRSYLESLLKEEKA